jgi:hypothetical protein
LSGLAALTGGPFNLSGHARQDAAYFVASWCRSTTLRIRGFSSFSSITGQLPDKDPAFITILRMFACRVLRRIGMLLPGHHDVAALQSCYLHR